MSIELPLKETLPHLIRRALAVPRDEVLLERDAGGAWVGVSSSELLERVQNVACAIRAAGLNAGDRVALVAHDCIDWIVVDFAALFAGCVVTPIYPTQALDHTAYILQHSGAKLLFTDNAETLAHMQQSGAAMPRSVLFEGDATNSLARFEADGAMERATHPEKPGIYEAALHPDDLAVLIYTSGTTGNPKGVMLSHDNLSFDAQAALAQGLDGVDAGSVVFSVLPFSHIFEHTIVYIYLLAQVRHYIGHDPNELLVDLQSVRPFTMTSVPRIFDKVLAGVRAKAMKAGGVQAKLVPWALATGREYMHAITLGGGADPILAFGYTLARALVLRKIRHLLGLDRMRFFTSGSAALHIDVAMTFLGLGIPILQGYGLTETSPVTTTSRMAGNLYGAVGRAIPGVELRIAEDGEVLTRGRQVMQGYYLEPEATAETIVDGWLHTGDVGEIDADGFLRITDRKKEVFKTDTGKFVAPGRVEAAIKRSIYVANAMVIGSGRPHPAALVVPNWDTLRLDLDLPCGVSTEALAARPDVIERLTSEVRRKTDDLASYEQIRRVIVIPHDFSVEGGELSPAMKIKRRVVEDRYAAEIERAYAADLHASVPA